MIVLYGELKLESTSSPDTPFYATIGHSLGDELLFETASHYEMD